jgi:hypothetical protein
VIRKPGVKEAQSVRGPGRPMGLGERARREARVVGPQQEKKEEIKSKNRKRSINPAITDVVQKIRVLRTIKADWIFWIDQHTYLSAIIKNTYETHLVHNEQCEFC